MKLGILSTEFALYDRDRNRPSLEARRIMEACVDQDVEPCIIDPTKIFLRLGREQPRLGYGDDEVGRDVFDSLDILMVKRTRHMTEQIADVVKTLELFYEHLPVFDPPGCYTRPTSKVESYLIRAKQGLPHPETFVGLSDRVEQSRIDIAPPLVWKPTHGTHGLGVQVIRNSGALANALRRLQVERSELGVQDETYGVHVQNLIEFDHEYRVVVIGGRAIGMAARVREAGWSTGSHSQLPAADFESCRDDAQAYRLAEEAADAHGYSFAGVDVLVRGEDYYVLECNRNPQFRRFERATDIDVAGQMVQYMVDHSR